MRLKCVHVLTSQQILSEAHIVEIISDFVIVGFDETLGVDGNRLVIVETVSFFEVGAIVLWHI